MKYKCNFQFSYSDMESKQRLFLGDDEMDLDDSATLLNAKDERITELEAEVSAWSDLWDEAMNAMQRCARKEAWHDEHPLLRFHHTKALKEQGDD